MNSHNFVPGGLLTQLSQGCEVCIPDEDIFSWIIVQSIVNLRYIPR